jgi:methionine-rich copper-binding protein CopC
MAGFALALVVAGVHGAVSQAQAHARYEDSTPARGERLTVSPPEVEITFTQEVQKITGSFDIQVGRDRGASATAGPAVVSDDDRRIVSVPLQPDLPPGRYVVQWNNVSDEDGDPAEGAFSFYLNHEPTTVDLDNDAQLEQIGAEDETPAAGETPGVAPTEDGTAPSPESTAGGPSTPVPTFMPIGGPEGDVIDDDDSALWIVIIVGVIAVVVVIAGGAFVWSRRRT